MWFIVVKVHSDPVSRNDMGARLAIWMESHKNHKLAEAYEKNLKGIIDSLAAPSQKRRFIEVVADTGATAVYASIWETDKGLDLSEVVKHQAADSGALRALFAWAASTGKKVTLTAADGALVRIYVEYGFEAVPGRTLPSGDMLKAKNINLPMQMSTDAAHKYASECRKDVFWEHLPDLVGA